ncbi:hypothetical protein L6R50_14060 [Myxococcota bacterium]|nr:hypothetical protein [Myxococcota bacterium]
MSRTLLTAALLVALAGAGPPAARAAGSEEATPSPAGAGAVRAVDAPPGVEDPRALRRQLRLAPDQTAVLVTGGARVRARFGDLAEFDRVTPYAVVGLPEGVHEVTLSRDGRVQVQPIKAVPGAVVALDTDAIFAQQDFEAPDRQAHEEELWRRLAAQIEAVPDVQNRLRLIEAFLRDHPSGWAAERAVERREELKRGYEMSAEDERAVSEGADLDAARRRQRELAELRLPAPPGSSGRRVAGAVLVGLGAASIGGAVAFEAAARDAAWRYHAARTADDAAAAQAWLAAARGDDAGRGILAAGGIALTAAGVVTWVVDAARTADWKARRREAGIASLQVSPGPGSLTVAGVLP